MPALRILLAFLFLAAVPAHADEARDAGNLVIKARIALGNLVENDDLKPHLRRNLARAKAVMIFPNLIKGAFLVGGEGGSGVLLTRNGMGVWSYPAFYTMATFSIGLQIGGQTSEAILIVLTDEGLDEILDKQVKLGVDLSVAAGPVGLGSETGATVGGVTDMDVDVLTYSAAQGLYVGGSLEGAVIVRRNDWNQSFYAPGATPEDIVIERSHTNPAADELLEALALLQ